MEVLLTATYSWNTSAFSSSSSEIQIIMVTRFSITPVQPDKLQLDRIPSVTRQAFLYFVHSSFFKRTDWYLAGGTALTLQVGHRQSVDLDFFIANNHFQETALERKLLATGLWKTNFRQSGTLYGLFQGAKMSFIAYPFFQPSVDRIRCGSVSMLTPADIAVMKVVATSQRGRKRDFVDLYWNTLHRESITDVLLRTIKQYPGQEDNMPHFLKSLVYFEDAEQDPMPKTYFHANWRTIKSFFRKEVPKVTKELLNIS